MQENSSSNFNGNVAMGGGLSDRWNLMVKQKHVIFLFIFLAIIVSGIYLALVKPIYKSEVYFVPPEESSVQSLNDWDLLLGRDNSYTPESVFILFKNYLSSRTGLWKFFKSRTLSRMYGVSSANEASLLNNSEEYQNTFNQFYEGYSVNLPRNYGDFKSFSVSFSLKTDKKKIRVNYSRLY